MVVAESGGLVCNLTAEEGMFGECVDVAVVQGQSLNGQVPAARRVAEVVASQKDRAIEERTGPVPEGRLVGMRSSLENEARSQTIQVTEGRMTGPCEDLWIERSSDRQQLSGDTEPWPQGLTSDSNWSGQTRK